MNVIQTRTIPFHRATLHTGKVHQPRHGVFCFLRNRCCWTSRTATAYSDFVQTKLDPTSEPKPNHGSTRGVRYLERPGRPNPFGVQWYETVFDTATQESRRAAKTMFFPTAESRERKAAEMREAVRSRMVFRSASRAEMEDMRAFKAAIGDTPWQTVVAGWQARLVATGTKPCAKKVEEAGNLYVGPDVLLIGSIKNLFDGFGKKESRTFKIVVTQT